MRAHLYGGELFKCFKETLEGNGNAQEVESSFLGKDSETSWGGKGKRGKGPANSSKAVFWSTTEGRGIQMSG